MCLLYAHSKVNQVINKLFDLLNTFYYLCGILIAVQLTTNLI